MDNQPNISGMVVENPQELGMIYPDKLFLMPNEVHADSATVADEVVLPKEPAPQVQYRKIVFLLDEQLTIDAGTTDITGLLGKMLSVALLEGKVPTMADAQIVDTRQNPDFKWSELSDNVKKIIVFSDQPLDNAELPNGFHIREVENKVVFQAPSIPKIMQDMAMKKQFAQELKAYFIS
jgi:hypothetical protein